MRSGENPPGSRQNVERHLRSKLAAVPLAGAALHIVASLAWSHASLSSFRSSAFCGVPFVDPTNEMRYLRSCGVCHGGRGCLPSLLPAFRPSRWIGPTYGTFSAAVRPGSTLSTSIVTMNNLAKKGGARPHSGCFGGENAPSRPQNAAPSGVSTKWRRKLRAFRWGISRCAMAALPSAQMNSHDLRNRRRRVTGKYVPSSPGCVASHVRSASV